jgi:PleD family two-component response regulator
VAASLAEAKELVSDHFDEIMVALLDLNLPDAPDGEVIAPVLAYGIPAIVFTGTYSDEVRESVLARNVLDYVTKESAEDLNYLLKLINRLQKNRTTKVLVVDDSSTTRIYIMNLLRLRKYHAFEADSGARALELLDTHPDIRLVITDYHMPEMDGFELTRKIRAKYTREQLAIIGISAQGSGAMSAQFLKKGANDFLVKPFVNEEFFCRIEQNLEVMEYIEEIHFLSQRDYLTGLGNRRYFLKHIALTLREFEAPRTLVARFGGEEFCIVFIDDSGDASQRIENLRQKVAASPVPWQEQQFQITISLGHICEQAGDLEAMLVKADELLYRAKQAGRNRVVEQVYRR